MRNKILVFISTCVLALSIFIINVSAATTNITSESDWNNLASQTSVNGNYKLTADITVTKCIKSFKGTFDGGGYKITFSDQSSNNVAPFEEISGTATISNLNTYLSRSASGSYVGGIVAHTTSSSNVTITNCYFNTIVSYNIYGSTAAGGIIGCSEGTVYIKNCDVAIGSSSTIGGGRAAGIVGLAKGNTKIIGCSIEGNKINGEVTAGGVIGHCDNSSSVIYKNRVKLSSLGLDDVKSGYYGFEGYGFIAGYFSGYASANFVYTTNVVNSSYCGYLVGTCATNASIINNAVETKATNVSKDYYKNAPSKNLDSNYRQGGLSSITNSTSYLVYPSDNAYGESYNKIEYKGTVTLLLDFGINIGCGDELCKGVGERYFNNNLSFVTGKSVDGDSYHKSLLRMYYDSNLNSTYKDIISIQGATINLADYGTPTKTHYTFKSWREPSGTSSKAVTTHKMSSNYDNYYIDYVYADWTVDKKTIYFDVDGASYKSRTAYYDTGMTLANSGTNIDVPNPTKTNYEFVRWEYKKGNKTYTATYESGLTAAKINELFDISGDIRFNAVFTKVSENINLDLDGGVLSNTFTPALNMNQSLTLPSEKPVKSGHEFLNYTISNGIRTFTLNAGDTLSSTSVNTLINESLTVTITANYQVNKLTISFVDYNPYYSIDGSTVSFNESFALPAIYHSYYGKYFDGFEFSINNKYYKFEENDVIPAEIINEIISESSENITIYLVWKNATIYDSTVSLTNENIDGYTFSSGTEIVEANKKYQGVTYTSGLSVPNGESFEYDSDKFYEATILTLNDNASLIINGIEYDTTNGLITAKFNAGNNTIVSNGDTTILNIGYNEMALSVDLKCQYDTANPSDATKIRFIAIIDSVIDNEELESGSFFVTINDTEKEFEITKIYRSITTLNGNLDSQAGRYYAVYTISGIQDAVASNVLVQSSRFELTTKAGNKYVCSHDAFNLGL